LGRSFEHAHTLRHHFLADAVARDDGHAIDAIGGHRVGSLFGLVVLKRSGTVAVKNGERHGRGQKPRDCKQCYARRRTRRPSSAINSTPKLSAKPPRPSAL